jgi:hypothetical protein
MYLYFPTIHSVFGEWFTQLELDFSTLYSRGGLNCILISVLCDFYSGGAEV